MAGIEYLYYGIGTVTIVGLAALELAALCALTGTSIKTTN